MSCPTYQTKNGLQIGGVDPSLVKDEPKTEVIFETSEEVEEIIEEKAEKPKQTRKPTKKATKKR